MTENQKTKMALLFMSKGNVTNAELAYEFVMAESEKSENMPSEEKPDGIYLILKKGDPVLVKPREPFENGDGCIFGYTGDLLDVIAIGIKMGHRTIAVALKDAADGEEIMLTDGEDKTNWDGYKNNYTDAVADWNGKENTAHLDKIGLNKDLALESGQYIPSMGEMYLIYLHKKVLNAVLSYVGGEPIAADWYWTSTEYSATLAWYLYLDNGGMNGGTKATTTRRVRPVSAFII
jgi:hypothetical protein